MADDDILNDADLGNDLKERFAQLPKALQNAILSADVEAQLKRLSESHQLHLDQWRALENEVMFALIGFEPVEKLAENIETELGIGKEAAASLATDISTSIFDPIRAELERETEAIPLKEASTETPAPAQSSASAIQPATPPPPPPQGTVARAPISSSYAAQQASHERKTIEGDPYREQVV